VVAGSLARVPAAHPFTHARSGTTATKEVAMHEISAFRQNLLRATYLLMLVGLAIEIWPGVINPPPDLALARGVVRSLLMGVSLMAAIGIVYPVRMLPLLLLELTWKTIWVVAFGLPLWLGGRMDADVRETMKACLMGVVLFPLVIPWPYVFAQLRRPGSHARPVSVPAAA
jgi:hypothetical protein